MLFTMVMATVASTEYCSHRRAVSG